MIKTFDIKEVAVEKSYHYTVVTESTDNDPQYHNFGSHCA